MYIKYFKNNFSDVRNVLFIILIIFVLIDVFIVKKTYDSADKNMQKNIDQKEFVVEKIIPLLDANKFDLTKQIPQIDTSENINYYYIYKDNNKIYQLIEYLKSYNLDVKHEIVNENNHIIKILNTNNIPFIVVKLTAEKKKDIPKKLKIKKQEEIKGKITIIIDDFGYFDNSITDGFINFPEVIICSVIPGHKYSNSLAKKINKSNNELFIHLPMEPLKYRGDEKEYIIMAGMSYSEIDKRIKNAIIELPQAVGINNHMGSRATSDLETMNNVAKVIGETELIFVDSYTYNKSVAYDVMKKHGITTSKRDYFIDNETDPKQISKQIDKLVERAIRNGKAMGIGHVKRNTLSVLQKKIPEIASKGVIFVPISEYIQ